MKKYRILVEHCNMFNLVLINIKSNNIFICSVMCHIIHSINFCNVIWRSARHTKLIINLLISPTCKVLKIVRSKNGCKILIFLIVGYGLLNQYPIYQLHHSRNLFCHWIFRSYFKSITAVIDCRLENLLIIMP